MTWEPACPRVTAIMYRDKVQRFICNHYLPILLGVWALSFLAGFPEVITATGVSIAATNIANYVTHSYGYRNFETKSEDRNNWLLAIVAFGDGWHNNHHANPRSYTTKVKWWEFDIGGMVVKYLLAAKGSLR